MAKKEEKKYKSTQSYLKIAEIKSDTLIMEGGEYVAVIAVSSTNFALKSNDEQNALIYGYQNFINSLDFEIQILMQSRKMDIHIYLDSVRKMMEQQTNELLRIQTAEYIEFVSSLVENASIMNKAFYVLVKHVPGSLGLGSSKKGLFGFLRRNKPLVDQAAAKSAKFEEERLKLERKVNTVVGGLSALGSRAIQLQTDELVELAYNSYNLDTGSIVDAGKLGDINLKAT